MTKYHFHGIFCCMAIHRLSPETLYTATKVEGQRGPKFIATPSIIFFGNEEEGHVALASYWRNLSEEDPKLFVYEQQKFKDQNLQPCGAHAEAEELAIVDAGLMLVEGLAVPETVTFTRASGEYGIGDRTRTFELAQIILGGTLRLHLTPQEK